MSCYISLSHFFNTVRDKLSHKSNANVSMGNTIAGKMEQVALSTDYPLNDSQNLIFAYSSSISLWI